jgi:hypothetical protein
MMLRISWRKKLAEGKDLPKVVKIEGKMSKKWGTGTCAIPAPMEVDELMRKVPKGKLTTVNEIRSAVAKKHKATIGCPITCGIFAWIAANAAEESAAEGKRRITPYWRTLKTGGELNPKYPGGVKRQSARLRTEGHTILAGKGKKPPTVEDYEKRLAKL